MLFLIPASKAQLRVYAGHDAIFCDASFHDIGPTLGDSLTISGGIPPYSYEWSAIDVYPASHYLDSITLPHPHVIGIPPLADSVLLSLTVTDSTGQTVTDTLVVHYSFFAYKVPIDAYYSKWDIDTIMLVPTVKSQYHPGGAEAPVTFSWSPSIALSDSTAYYPLCWVPVSTIYTLTVTDRFGCKADPALHYVQVVPNGITEISGGNNGISIWPNPAMAAGTMIRVPDNLRGLTFNLYDQQGRRVRQLSLQKAVTPLNTSELSPGIYMYQVSGRTQSYSGKLIIGN